MLTEPRDKKTNGALARLQGDGDWNTVMEWLKETLATQRELNDSHVDEVLLRQGQGCAQTLSTLLKSSEKSQELYRKLA